MSNSKRISVSVTAETRNNLQALCEVEKRSMSNFVKLLIQSAIDTAKAKGKIE
ncbi:ribbon-helix-helix domain-containing protein [Microseira wollei]